MNYFLAILISAVMWTVIACSESPRYAEPVKTRYGAFAYPVQMLDSEGYLLNPHTEDR